MNSLRIFLFLTVCHTAFSGTIIKNGLKIIGGSDANIEDYPYQVSIEKSSSQTCGGSILNARFILTDAHCIFFESSIDHMRVRVGSSQSTTNGYVYKISKSYIHPLFSTKTFDYDIALLELETELTFGPGVQPVTLDSSDSIIVDGMLANVTGYGLVSENGLVLENGPRVSRLKVLTVPTMTKQSCETYRDKDTLTERMICAGYIEGGKDVCWGDGGDPLVVSGIQIGMVSFGNMLCAMPNSPSVYTRISALNDYINSIIQHSN